MRERREVSVESFRDAGLIAQKYGDGFLHKKSWFAYREDDNGETQKIFLVHRYSNGRKVVDHVIDLLTLTHALHDCKNPFAARKARDKSALYCGDGIVQVIYNESIALVILDNFFCPLEISEAERLVFLAWSLGLDVPNDSKNLKFGVYRGRLCVTKQLDAEKAQWLIVNEDVKVVTISDEDDFRLLTVPERICIYKDSYIFFDGKRCWRSENPYIYEDEARRIANYYNVKKMLPVFYPVMIRYEFCWMIAVNGSGMTYMDVKNGVIHHEYMYFTEDFHIVPVQQSKLYMFYKDYKSDEELELEAKQ